MKKKNIIMKRQFLIMTVLISSFSRFIPFFDDSSYVNKYLHRENWEEN